MKEMEDGREAGGRMRLVNGSQHREEPERGFAKRPAGGVACIRKP